MNFGQAIAALKTGYKVARKGWNGVGLWLELQTPGAHSKMTLPYIFMSYPDNAKTTPGARVPWLASQTDMLAEDWCIVGNESAVNSVGEYELPIGQTVKIDGYPFELREPVRALSSQHVLDVLSADKNTGIQAV
ncbi:DUF2829 domain-containing protein [Yersinia kristensenii]|uniref:DUF2829 domain-containing protein n=1 Tax=Yersinia kristensenii TaxID=28152 RepID=UPI0005E5E85E|nr:DUF2829 domain-containing protein [Yersinia kristensenii]CFR12444.1 Protein of uncharacterised function (DUF2829) [Yersinia kristensenii]